MHSHAFEAAWSSRVFKTRTWRANGGLIDGRVPNDWSFFSAVSVFFRKAALSLRLARSRRCLNTYWGGVVREYRFRFFFLLGILFRLSSFHALLASSHSPPLFSLSLSRFVLFYFSLRLLISMALSIDVGVDFKKKI